MKLTTICAVTFMMTATAGCAISLDANEGSEHTKKVYAAFHVDSNEGNDSNDGLSEQTPWKSFANIRKGLLSPGDSVKIKRGSHFKDMTLYVEDSGVEKEPVIVTDYGEESLAAPTFTNEKWNPSEGEYGNCIRLKGSWIVLENMYCDRTVADLPKEPGIGFETMWEMGAIYIDKTASHCLVRNNETNDCGVGIKSYGKYAVIDNNYVHDCNRPLKQWNWGPIGIWLGADFQEVKNNRIINYSAVDPNFNWGPDGYGSGADGGALEIDDARVAKSHIEIHHNYSRDNQGFIEVTWTDVLKNPDYRNFHVHHNVCDDYQQFVALWCGKYCCFENNTIVRRKRNTNDWGIFNITSYDSGNIVRKNIIVTEKGIEVFPVGKNGTSQPNSEICDNIYWDMEKKGEPYYGHQRKGSGAIVDDPLFVDYNGMSRESFKLRETSPYYNSGIGAF